MLLFLLCLRVIVRQEKYVHKLVTIVLYLKMSKLIIYDVQFSHFIPQYMLYYFLFLDIFFADTFCVVFYLCFVLVYCQFNLHFKLFDTDVKGPNSYNLFLPFNLCLIFIVVNTVVHPILYCLSFCGK